MIQSAPKYYETSLIYEQMQQAQADEYEAQEVKAADLQLQLNASTATWGLNYWEEALGLPVKELDGYPLRRGRVIAKLIGPGNFSAKHLKALATGYGEDIRVSVNASTFTITVTFLRGIPTFLDEYVELADNIVHAHLGIDYKFEWHIEGSVGIKTDYTRYLYYFPICNTIFCGTWPGPIDQAYTATYHIGGDANDIKVDQSYKLCGTIPYSINDGYSVPGITLDMDTTDNDVDHVYNYCNTINASEEGKL